MTTFGRFHRYISECQGEKKIALKKLQSEPSQGFTELHSHQQTTICIPPKKGVPNMVAPGLAAGATRLDKYFPRVCRFPIPRLMPWMAEERSLSLKETFWSIAGTLTVVTTWARVYLRLMMAKVCSIFPETAELIKLQRHDQLQFSIMPRTKFRRYCALRSN